MKKAKKVKKHRLIRALLTVVIVIVSIVLVIDVALAVYAKYDSGQFIGPMLKNALYSYQKPDYNKATIAIKKELKGTALGVCHPKNDSYNVSLLQDANIEWVRFDITDPPYVVNADGTPKLDENDDYIETEDYKNFKARCKIFQDKGIRVFAITPYIDDMLIDLDNYAQADGVETNYYDIFNNGGSYPEAFETMMKGFSTYYANDLTGNNEENYQYVSCIQISNELTVDKWMGALTKDQIVYYLVELQMKEMHEICQNNNVPIGYNTQGMDLVELPSMMVEYGEYYDFVGLDLYLGCFESSYKTIFIYELLTRYLFNLTKKPIMLAEFGYISAGTPKSTEEREAYLKETFPLHPSEAAIKADIMGFLDEWETVVGEESSEIREARRKYNEIINNSGTVSDAEQAAIDYVFKDTEIAHLYKALPDGYQLTKYLHDEEGQANFYTDTIEMLSKLDFICGIFCYCYSDSTTCYQCGQEGCPVETGWGLVSYADGETNYNANTVHLKKSYYAIQEAFGKIKASDAKKYK